MVSFKKINNSVFYAADKIVTVSRHDIRFLKGKAQRTESKSARLCAHRNVNDKIHEMIILHSKETYVRPHKHPHKTVSYHVIEGKADLILFNEGGKIMDVIKMGDYASGRTFFYRVFEPYYYMPLVTSDILVFDETINGPYKKNGTIYAPWAPEVNHSSEVKEFLKRLYRTMRSGEIVW